VQFTDKSQNATTWSWDFNGDGVADSSAQNPPAYTYTTAGNYTANLTVSNANGSDSKLATIAVQQASTGSNNGGNGGSSGGSSSGGSGGSSGGSSSGGSGSSSNGSVGSHNTVNNTSSIQVPSKIVPQNEKGAKAGTGNNSQVNNDDGTVKIVSFLIGLLVILLASALILKKIGPKQEK
jgi:PKD repeat protein